MLLMFKLSKSSTSNSNQQNDWVFSLCIQSFLISMGLRIQRDGERFDLWSCSAKLPAMKKEFVWLKEVDSIAIQSSVRNLADAYTRFFKKTN